MPSVSNLFNFHGQDLVVQPRLGVCSSCGPQDCVFPDDVVLQASFIDDIQQAMERFHVKQLG